MSLRVTLIAADGGASLGIYVLPVVPRAGEKIGLCFHSGPPRPFKVIDVEHIIGVPDGDEYPVEIQVVVREIR